MVFIVRQGCWSVCSSSGRPFVNFQSHVTIVRMSWWACEKQLSILSSHRWSGASGKQLSPALGNVGVLFKEPCPSPQTALPFQPPSLETRPLPGYCFQCCAGAVSSTLVQIYSQ